MPHLSAGVPIDDTFFALDEATALGSPLVNEDDNFSVTGNFPLLHSPTAFASSVADAIPNDPDDLVCVAEQRDTMLGAIQPMYTPTKRPRPEAATNASMPSGTKKKTPRLHPPTYTCPVLRSIKKVSGAGKKTVSEVDALLMPFLRQIEKSNQELQDAKHLGLDRKAMKQLLHKVTQDRMQILKDAQTQLSPGAHKRLKRLLGPLAKDVEQVRARFRVRVLAKDVENVGLSRKVYPQL